MYVCVCVLQERGWSRQAEISNMKIKIKFCKIKRLSGIRLTREAWTPFKPTFSRLKIPASLSCLEGTLFPSFLRSLFCLRLEGKTEGDSEASGSNPGFSPRSKEEGH